jgi:hypothetical protein
MGAGVTVDFLAGSGAQPGRAACIYAVVRLARDAGSVVSPGAGYARILGCVCGL